MNKLIESMQKVFESEVRIDYNTYNNPDFGSMVFAKDHKRAAEIVQGLQKLKHVCKIHVDGTEVYNREDAGEQAA